MALKVCNKCGREQEVSLRVCIKCKSESFSPFREGVPTARPSGLIRCTKCGREYNAGRLGKCPLCSSSEPSQAAASASTSSDSVIANELANIRIVVEEMNKRLRLVHWAIASLGVILIVAFYLNGIKIHG